MQRPNVFGASDCSFRQEPDAATESLRPEPAGDARIFCGQKIRENDIDRVKIVFNDGARNGSPALR